MEVQLYIKGQKIDLFKDEKISINLSVKNINDLSKVRTDFTQSFTIPCTPRNNLVFEHWYNADVDGTFNSNIRVEAYIEVNSLPFRYGTIQLENSKLKNGLPYAYSCTFYGEMVSLSDLFKEDTLSLLDGLDSYNHSYNESDVINSMNSNSLHGGDVYYPLINCLEEMSLQSPNPARDLENNGNNIAYNEFKPAIREIRIIEAIEQKYNITFSRDFFNRSIFHNLFLWLNKDKGVMRSTGGETKIDIQSVGNLLDIQIIANTTTNKLSFIPLQYALDSSGFFRRIISVVVTPDTLSINTPYKLRTYRGDKMINEVECTGIGSIIWVENTFITTIQDFYFTITPYGEMNYNSVIHGNLVWQGVNGVNSDMPRFAINGGLNNLTSEVIIKDQMPDLKIKDYLNSLIMKFNLIVVPNGANKFIIDTLDTWQSKGKTYNLNKYIDIQDIEVKKANVKKKIDFLYQKTETILGKKYFENNLTTYGDLKTTFDIAGDDLKIESQFENMMFERMQRETGGELTELQAGYCIDKNLKPMKPKPIRFYRNGIDKCLNPIKIQPLPAINTVWHTATEDNRRVEQVTNCLNFGSDISTYFYTSVEQSLYFNFWKTYIEDLFDMKNRVLGIKGKLPTYILYQLKMNDKFIVQDKRYKISELKIDLTTGDFSGEIYTDFSKPSDTIDNEIPLSVDNEIITVDSENITVDKISTYSPILSFITNGISLNNYTSSMGTEFFEVKITANTDWNIQKIDNGFGTNWFEVNKILGSKSDFVRVEISESTVNRTGKLRFNIGTETFDLNIFQL